MGPQPGTEKVGPLLVTYLSSHPLGSSDKFSSIRLAAVFGLCYMIATYSDASDSS